MKIGQKGIDLIAEFEGRRNQLYYCPGGYPTIGIGHKLRNEEIKSGFIQIGAESVYYKNGLTDQQIEDLLRQDVKTYEDAVNSLVRVPLNQNQFDALVSFTFNLGVGNLADSTLLRVLNGSKYDSVPDQLRKWVYAGGKRLRGLVRRREAEIELWNEPMDSVSELVKESSRIEESLKDIILSKVRLIQDVATEIEDLLDQNH